MWLVTDVSRHWVPIFLYSGRVIVDVPMTHDEGELTIWTDEDREEEPYVWPIKISEVAEKA